MTPSPSQEACAFFWHYYPRKVGEKQAVYDAFVRAVAINNGDAAAIVEGARRHAAWCAWNYKKQEQQRYIKMPINWLRDEEWKDTSQQLDPYDGCYNADAARQAAAQEEYDKVINGDLADLF